MEKYITQKEQKNIEKHTTKEKKGKKEKEKKRGKKIKIKNKILLFTP